MRVPSNLGRGSLGFNMTPMIDIVFQLIIFFLLASNLSRQEVQQDVDLPSAQSGSKAEQEDVRRTVINVLADGQISLGGRIVPVAELERLLQLRRSEAGENVEVRIRCHRGTPYELVEPVMVSCARAKLWNIKLAVVREKG
jgi:biopolymer transport protein ExbD